MQRYTPPLSRTLRIATIMLFTAALLVTGLAFAQDGQIDQEITKTMWSCTPMRPADIDRLDQLRIPYIPRRRI